MFMLENVTESPSENAADNPQHSAAGEGCILLVTYYIYIYVSYIYIYVNREREREIDRCKQYIYIYIITCIITTSA